MPTIGTDRIRYVVTNCQSNGVEGVQQNRCFVISSREESFPQKTNHHFISQFIHRKKGTACLKRYRQYGKHGKIADRRKKCHHKLPMCVTPAMELRFLQKLFNNIHYFFLLINYNTYPVLKIPYNVSIFFITCFY